MQWIHPSYGTTMMLSDAPTAGYMLSMLREVIPIVQTSTASVLAAAKAAPKHSTAMCSALLRSHTGPNFVSAKPFAAPQEFP